MRPRAPRWLVAAFISVWMLQLLLMGTAIWLTHMAMAIDRSLTGVNFFSNVDLVYSQITKRDHLFAMAQRFEMASDISFGFGCLLLAPAAFRFNRQKNVPLKGFA
jgi:hypothetical protein